jgi:triosephosphate isomerase
VGRRPFIAGNWKMNKTPDEAKALAVELKGALGGVSSVDVAICPAFVCLHAVRDAIQGSTMALGAQNIHWEKSGAFTGEISGAMLKACGVEYAIIGHSERRQYFGETDETVNKRLKAALAAGLKPIVCVGETLGERESGVTEKVVQRQVEGALQGLTAADLVTMTMAYEPVWAIGTGKTATPDQAQDVHAFIRKLLRGKLGAGMADACRIQYGGSVNAANAKTLMGQPDIDGALVGGASLKTADFATIVQAAG